TPRPPPPIGPVATTIALLRGVMSDRTGKIISAGKGGPNAPDASGLMLPAVSTVRFVPELSFPPAPACSPFRAVDLPAEFADSRAPAASVFPVEGAVMAKTPSRVPGGRTICETAADGFTLIITRSPELGGLTEPAGLPAFCVVPIGLATITVGAGSCACEPNAFT